MDEILYDEREQGAKSVWQKYQNTNSVHVTAIIYFCNPLLTVLLPGLVL